MGEKRESRIVGVRLQSMCGGGGGGGRREKMEKLETEEEEKLKTITAKIELG